MSGPCLSSNVAVHPLRPATRLRLGKPLPHQLADRPQAPPLAPSQALGRSACAKRPHPVLLQLSLNYPNLKGRLLTCYSPVRRFPPPCGDFSLDLHVLTTPLAFTLSQDQTLRTKSFSSTSSPLHALSFSNVLFVLFNLNILPSTLAQSKSQRPLPPSSAYHISITLTLLSILFLTFYFLFLISVFSLTYSLPLRLPHQTFYTRHHLTLHQL